MLLDPKFSWDKSNCSFNVSVLKCTVVRLAFNQMLATVSEGDGEIEFSLEVVEGSLGVDYSLNVSTDSQNGGADGKWGRGRGQGGRKGRKREKTGREKDARELNINVLLIPWHLGFMSSLSL